MPIYRVFVLAALMLVTACGRASSQPEASMAQHQHDPSRSPEALSLGRITPREPGAVLELLSEAVDTHGAIYPRYSAYGDNLSPALRWTFLPSNRWPPTIHIASRQI